MRWLVVLVAACSGAGGPPPTPSGPPAPMTATPMGSDDAIVATVNGRPVWGSCVTAQSKGKTREQAVRECIDFELLAQIAEQRGFAPDREVATATRTAMVSQLIAKVYEDGYQKPEDFGDMWKRLYERGIHTIKHPEYRGSAYARVVVPEKATPEQDAAAKAVAEKIAAGLANEHGLPSKLFFELATKLAGDTPLETQEVVPMLHRALVKEYADALYALPEAGRTTGAIRTQWGWDVVLLTEIVPETHPTQEEIDQQILPIAKRNYFQKWVDDIRAGLGIKVTPFPQNIALLDDDAQPAGSAAPPGGTP